MQCHGARATKWTAVSAWRDDVTARRKHFSEGFLESIKGGLRLTEAGRLRLEHKRTALGRARLITRLEPL